MKRNKVTALCMALGLTVALILGGCGGTEGNETGSRVLLLSLRSHRRRMTPQIRQIKTRIRQRTRRRIPIKMPNPIKMTSQIRTASQISLIQRKTRRPIQRQHLRRRPAQNLPVINQTAVSRVQGTIPGTAVSRVLGTAVSQVLGTAVSRVPGTIPGTAVNRVPGIIQGTTASLLTHIVPV